MRFFAVFFFGLTDICMMDSCPLEMEKWQRRYLRNYSHSNNPAGRNMFKWGFKNTYLAEFCLEYAQN